MSKPTKNELIHELAINYLNYCMPPVIKEDKDDQEHSIHVMLESYMWIVDTMNEQWTSDLDKYVTNDEPQSIKESGTS